MAVRATIVEADRKAVGLAVRSGAGFRFFASDDVVARLEGRRFRSLNELERAVRRAAGKGPP